MTEKQTSILKDLAVGLAIAVFVIYQNRTQEFPFIHLLCDGFFVSAVLLLGSGGLVLCRNKGAFDMVTYGTKSVVNMVFPFAHWDEPEDGKEDYVTYCERKASERKPKYHLLVAGAVYLVLSAVCMVIYSLTA